METKFYRFYVVANFPTYKHKFAFSSTDKKQAFVSCVNFAEGFIKGYCVNANLPISTNCVQSIDGYIWWHSSTNETLLSIEDENGKTILTENDL